MSLEAFIDIRFGDPVLGISMDFEGLVYGSMTGRLLYHHFLSGDEKTLRETSEECIRGVWLGNNHTIYAAVGDLKVIVIQNVDSNSYQQHAKSYERVHNSMDCPSTQVITYEDQCCLLQLEQTPPVPRENSSYVVGVVLKNFYTDVSTELVPLPLPPHCVPMDFDGKRLLWLEYTSTGLRTLRIFDFATKTRFPVLENIKKSVGHLSFARIAKDNCVFVLDRRKLMIKPLFGESERARVIGLTRHDLVACSLIGVQTLRPRRVDQDGAEGNLNDARIDVRHHSESVDEPTDKPLYSRLYILTADTQGKIVIWDETGPAETILISELRELTQEYQRMDYFSMGYPYFITACGPRVAVSTDHGVLVLKSKVLEAQAVLRIDI